MSDTEVIQKLTEIKAAIEAGNVALNDIKETLKLDRSKMWNLLMLVIGGAFALIGIKLVMP